MEELRELIRVLESSSLAEMEIEEHGRRVRLSKGGSPSIVPSGAPALAAPSFSPPPPPAYGPPTTSQAPVAEPLEEGLVTIDSPMVGTFYPSPAPGDPPFVTIGEQVEADQTVCIIEAMKIMNEVAVKFPAVIEKMLVETGEPVEFGQPLFAVRPLE